MEESLQLKTKTMKVNGKTITLSEVPAEKQERFLEILNAMGTMADDAGWKEVYTMLYEAIEIGTGIKKDQVKAGFSLAQMKLLIHEISDINGIGGKAPKKESARG